MKIFKTKKNDAKKLNSLLICDASEFSYAKGEIERRLPNEPNEAILFLEYVKKTIAIDISSTFQAALFYTKDIDISWTYNIIPTSFVTDNGKITKLIKEKEESVIVKFENTIVITLPWSIRKLPPILQKIKTEGFTNDAENQQAIFYKEMDICVVHNGFHSIAAGKHFGKGEIKALICETSLAYPHITTDGKYWYCDGKIIQNDIFVREGFRVNDIRFALLYEISKKINRIRS